MPQGERDIMQRESGGHKGRGTQGRRLLTGAIEIQTILQTRCDSVGRLFLKSLDFSVLYLVIIE